MMQAFARSVSPTLVLVLTLLWVVLNQTLAPGQFVLGALLGVGLSWAGSTLRPVQARVRRLDVCSQLTTLRVPAILTDAYLSDLRSALDRLVRLELLAIRGAKAQVERGCVAI